ncbi:MAG: hypothetical protein Q9N68_13645 [Gammaproteobacteria bacterium]|nr:hypothetical protein [Gammaproteobacteria bacterium]
MNNSITALLSPPISVYHSALKHVCTAPIATLWGTGLIYLAVDLQNEQLGFGGALGLLLWLTASLWSLLLINSKKSTQCTNNTLYVDNPLLTLQQQMRALGSEQLPVHFSSTQTTTVLH